MSVILTCIVDAKEHPYVATVDILNSFIQTCIGDEKGVAIINIRGFLVYILLEIAPDVYGPYAITDRKGVKQLIVQCQI